MFGLFEGLYNLVVNLMKWLGPVGLFFGMILQAVIAPVPSELVLYFAGTSIGWKLSTLFGGLGELAGAFVSFWISARFGRPIVEKLVGKEHLEFADDWFNIYGGWAVLLGRLLPFVPFDAISYGAGLTKMSKKKFMLATAFGAFPRAFFYSFIGYASIKHIETKGFETTFKWLLLTAVFFILLLIIVPKIVKKRLDQKKEKKWIEIK